MRGRCVRAGMGIAAVVWAAATAAAQCPREWARGFEVPGLDGPAYALLVYDDGTGPALHVGGDFYDAGTAASLGVARWDGRGWSPVGTPSIPQYVHALIGFDDGSGVALYAGTNSGPYRCKNGQWSAVGYAPFHGHAFAVYDDGSGPALYAGDGPWKWDGHTWSLVGGGVGGYSIDPGVYALQVFDDGTGPKLAVGGVFDWVGDHYPANSIAAWDGTAWSRVGTGFDWDVYALTVFDDGSGPALYAGGTFLHAGNVPAQHVAKWDGTAWSGLGAGVGDNWSGHGVLALAGYDDGRGRRLFAGGDFTTSANPNLNHVAAWDGTGWSPMITGTNRPVRAFAQFAPVANSSGLHVAGDFAIAGGAGCPYVARWDGERFSALGTGLGLSDLVRASCHFDAGQGPAVYVGGFFRSAGTSPAMGLARWTGNGWAGIMDNPCSNVGTLAAFNDGHGEALYAFGTYDTPYVRWDGANWVTIGGFWGAPVAGYVTTACIYDDGTGPGLYVGGDIGGASISYVAKWDGAAWSSLAGGLNGPVLASAVFDAGQGPTLYLGGEFTAAMAHGNPPLNYLARWDGRAWSALPGGFTNEEWAVIDALRVHDDGRGAALYLAGGFATLGGAPFNNIARWSANGFEALGSGTNGSVLALETLDEGSGPALFVGGAFADAGGQPIRRVARWRNRTWSAVGSDFDGIPFRLMATTIHGLPALLVAGDIYTAGGHTSGNIALWRCIENWLPGDLNCDGVVDWRDIDPYVLALSDPVEYQQRYPNCPWLNADCNSDGHVDFGDINPMVALLERSPE